MNRITSEAYQGAVKQCIMVGLAFFLLGAFSVTAAVAATINASSCSQADVQTAVNSANDGDTVQVPAGSCSWSSGITISGIKLIGAGKSAAGTVITTGTVTINKHPSYPTGVSGFRFTGSGRHVDVDGSPSARMAVIDNNYFFTNGGSGGNTMLGIRVNGVLLYQNDFIASAGTTADVFNIITSEDWSQPPTYGTMDTTGERNIYLEDNTFTNILETAPDGDAGGRYVIRHNTYIDSSITFHGGYPNDSSPNGGTRQFEVYNNTFRRVSNAQSINKWIWVRGSSGVIANNNMDRADSPDGHSYPNKPEILMTVGCPDPYPEQYQVGQSNQNPENPPSHPVLIFGNSGDGPSDNNFISIAGSMTAGPPCATPDLYIQENRDYFRSNQWGWVPYTYPHPLRSGTPPPPDTEAPTTPANLQAGASSASSISLTWDAATDNVGVTGYRILRCQGASCTPTGEIATSAAASYADSGLAADTGYCYSVLAYDAAGNESGHSNIAQAATLAPDVQAPSTPAGLNAAAVSHAQIDLTWTAATDNVAVTGYRVHRDGVAVGTTAATSYSDTGLAPDTTYSYTVSAYDAAGNESAPCAAVQATTADTSGDEPAALPEGNNGISALYPGDADIASHNDVIFADDFESYDSASNLTNRWDEAYHAQNLRVATESGNFYKGAKGLEMMVPQGAPETSNTAIKYLNPTEDTVFIRFYAKYDSGFDVAGSSHNGVSLLASYWDGPGSGPGIPADGYNKFYVGVEAYREADGPANPGSINVYIYHPDQRDIWGDHFYPTGRVLPFDAIPGDFGPYFVPRPEVVPQLGRWYAYEVMVKANTPGQRDGRIAIWLDGNLIADFLNIRLRETFDLKMDRVCIDLHIRNNSQGVARKWYDNVVVARSYIGPLVDDSTVFTCSDGLDNDVDGLIDYPDDPGCTSATDDDETDPVADTTPPSEPGDLNAAAVSHARIDLAWTASSDNTAVAGYKVFRDNVEVMNINGTSCSDTGLDSETTYSYTVSAYDAAGNESLPCAAVEATTQAGASDGGGGGAGDSNDSGDGSSDSGGGGGGGCFINSLQLVGLTE